MRAFLCALVRAWYRPMNYRRDGKGKLAIGVYPEVSLKEAGEARDQARAKLRAGHGPSEHKQLSKLTPKLSVDTRFQTIAMDWLESRGTWRSQRGRRRHGCWRPTPSFGWQSARSMKISTAEVLAVLRRLEAQEKVESTQRLRQLCGQVFRYAVATGRSDRDPTSALRGKSPSLLGVGLGGLLYV